jgi:hypothetical protein
MESTTLSTPFSGSGAATIVSSSSARAVRARGGGGAFHCGCGVMGAAFERLGFLGQLRDMCPCYLQKKHRPSAMSRHLSSSLRDRVLMASTSIAFGSREEELPPCLHCLKRLCHWFLVPKFPWLLFCGWKERMAFLARYFRSLSRATCYHWPMVLGQTSRFMIALRVPGQSPDRNASMVPSFVNSHPAFAVRELNAVM